MDSTGSLTIVRQGFQRAAGKWGVLGLLYALNLLITLPLALAFQNAASALAIGSPAIDELFPAFVYTIYDDFTRVHADAITAFRNMLGPVMLVSVVLHAVLGVGLARVMDTDGFAREFFGGIVTYGWRAVRLLLVWILIAAILVVVIGFVSTMIFTTFTQGNVTEDAYALAAVVVGVLFGLTLSIVILGAEYSRILTVRENRQSMFRSAWDGLVLVIRHPVRMALLHGSVLVSILVAALLYVLVEDVVGMTSAIGVVLMFLVQQAFILFRMFTRMWNTANGVRYATLIASSRRPSYVQAPSVHDRASAYRQPPEKGPVAPRRDGREERGKREEGRGAPGDDRQGGRSGYRRRGRRRGSGGSPRSGGGPSGTQAKPESSAPPPPKSDQPQSGGPSGGEKSDKPRRRRRPPRRRSGNA